MEDDGRVTHQRSRTDPMFAIVLTLVFLAVVGPVVMHHEMWRDEVQAWLLARDSSIPRLFTALHYEGHPSLWYLTLRLFTPFSPGVRTVQLVSLVFGAASVYLFALRAPLPRIVRALFAFSYFVAYGYTVVARSYSLEMFLIMLICIFATEARTQRSLILLGTALLLLANTSVYGVILVMAFVGAIVMMAIFGVADTTHTGATGGTATKTPSLSIGRRLRQIAIPVAFAVIGTGLALAQIWPRADSIYFGNGAATSVASGMTPRKVSVAYRLTPMWRAFVPIPPLDSLGNMWEGDMLLHRSPRAEPVAAVLSITIVVVLIGVLARSPLAATFFGLAVLGNLLFSLLIYAGSLYHHGHFFLAFMMALWIGAADSRWREPRGGENRFFAWFARWRMQLIGLMLLFQVAGAAIRLVADYREPFSEGEAVAAFIDANFPPTSIVASDPGFNGTTVSGYLDRPIYEVDRSRFATFTPLGVRGPLVIDSQIVQHVRECCARAGAPAVLLLNHPLASDLAPPPLIAKFDQSIQPSERYFVYRIDAAASSSIAPHPVL